MKKIAAILALLPVLLAGQCEYPQYAFLKTLGGFGALDIPNVSAYQVRTVTSLADAGAGSFRDALENCSGSIIVFDPSIVPGTIPTLSTILVEQDTGVVIIGDGITIAGMGGLSVYQSQHVYVRGFKVRLDSASAQDGMGATYSRDVVIDHCSVMWTADGTIDVQSSFRVTVSNCLMAESRYRSGHPNSPGHNTAMLIQNSDSVSLIHNLIAHHRKRCPQVSLSGCVDMRENVIYNWIAKNCIMLYPMYGPDTLRIRLEGNFFKHGPGSTNNSSERFVVMVVDSVFRKIRLYVEADTVRGFVWTNSEFVRWYDIINGVTTRQAKGVGLDSIIVQNEPFVAPPAIEIGKKFVFDYVMQTAGSPFPDADDTRVKNEVYCGTGIEGFRQDDHP